MKAHIFILLFLALLFQASAVSANTLNEVVKEARKQGQVLSAKTRQGMHEVRVVTPRGSVKTIRKPAIQNNQRQPEPSNRTDYYQQRTQPPTQRIERSDIRRKNPYSRQPELRRFNRSSQSTRSSRSQQPAQQAQPQPRRQPSPRRSDKRDPD